MNQRNIDNLLRELDSVHKISNTKRNWKQITFHNKSESRLECFSKIRKRSEYHGENKRYMFEDAALRDGKWYESVRQGSLG